MTASRSRELRRVCRPGGLLLVTVPAYQALWSLHDEANHHYRRYSRRVAARRPRVEAGWRGRADELVQQPAAGARGGRPAGPAPAAAPTTATRNDLELGPAWLNDALEQPLRARGRLAAARATRCRPGCRCWRCLRKPWTARRLTRRAIAAALMLALGRDHQRLEQPRLPAAGDHRPGVDGRSVAGRDRARAGRGPGQPGQARASGW